MKGWTPQAVERAAGGQKLAPARTSPLPAPTEPQTRPASREKPEKEPTGQQPTLPPPPANPGPHQVGHWTIRNTRAYAPDSRVVLTGPETEFEQLLAHLKLFKP